MLLVRLKTPNLCAYMSTELSAFTKEKSPHSKNVRLRPKWLRMKDLLCSRTYGYEFLKTGQVLSVIFRPPGSKKGIRLIDADSFDAYLLKLAAEQKESSAEGAK
jgi:hypothetical protein